MEGVVDVDQYAIEPRILIDLLGCDVDGELLEVVVAEGLEGIIDATEVRLYLLTDGALVLTSSYKLSQPRVCVCSSKEPL